MFKNATSILCFKVVCRMFQRRYVRIKGTRLHRLLNLDNEIGDDDPEGFGNVESDFMNINKLHKEHERQLQGRREKIKHSIIERKYFKESQPNFLTWAEKDQIRLLNQRDPTEWKSEKLAESFPANVEIIEKILKNNWKPRSEHRIEVHDKKVFDNWNLFRDRKFNNLNHELKEHLNKFAKRKLEDIKNMKIDWTVRPELPKPVTNEFSSIITSCKKYRVENKMLEDGRHTVATSSNNVFRKTDTENETFLSEKIADKKYMRFSDIKSTIDAGTPKLSENEDDNDGKLDQNNNTYETDGVLKRNPFNTNVKKIETNEVTLSTDEYKNFFLAPIKERITIPKKLYKKGKLYKIDDCYYDDDGMLLYRVPGMTGRKI